jgi:hypothetical protein
MLPVRPNDLPNGWVAIGFKQGDAFFYLDG